MLVVIKRTCAETHPLIKWFWWLILVLVAKGFAMWPPYGDDGPTCWAECNAARIATLPGVGARESLEGAAEPRGNWIAPHGEP